MFRYVASEKSNPAIKKTLQVGWDRTTNNKTTVCSIVRYPLAEMAKWVTIPDSGILIKSSKTF